MRRLLATVSNFALLPLSLAGMALISSACYGGRSSPVQFDQSPAGTLCGPEDVVVYEQDQSKGDVACLVRPRTPEEVAEARAYLLETSSPGYTMMEQGPELAIERLHPEFAVRLANAIREARDSGLPSAGIFSAYRPPAFGVGGFADKFNSLHSYGLAADLRGIGDAASPEAQHWHEIAALHGVICPYGPSNKTEWNHCQPTALKIVGVHNPLRGTITADGPLSLEEMFEVGDSIIENSAIYADNIPDYVPEHLMAHASNSGNTRGRSVNTAASAGLKRTSDRVEDRTDKRRDRRAQKTASKATGQGRGEERWADKTGGRQLLAKRITTIEEKRGTRKSSHHLTLVVISGLADGS
jgi:hypothetical protein